MCCFFYFVHKLNQVKSNSHNQRVKERWAEHFENVLNHNEVTGNDIEKNEKFCDSFELKEDLFCEDKLDTVLNRFKK